jgi:hypothetical protein
MFLKYILYFIIVQCAVSAACVPCLAEDNDEQGKEKSSVTSSFSQSKFVPDISLITDFSTVGRNLNDKRYNSLETPGFPTSGSDGENGDNPSGMNARRGFNLNYCELALSSVVDPYFDLFATFHLTESSFEIEEAYCNTRFLPFGLKFKAGKFLSHFGRINEQHAHNQDFADMPLVYRTFFGEDGLLEKGMRLTWVLPVPVYCMLGAEILQGQNASSFGTEGFTDATGTHRIKNSVYPNLYVGYMKTSFDIGELTILFGASFAGGKSRINNDVDNAANPEGNAEYSTTAIIGSDLTVKYYFDSCRYISLQSEYLNRDMEGDRFDSSGGKMHLSKKQSGLYSQLVARFAQRWRVGVRFDLLQLNQIKIGGTGADIPENLARYSGMIDFSPTEFSRIRLQYNIDRSGYLNDGTDKKTNHEVFLQVNLAIGAHGAHSF